MVRAGGKNSAPQPKIWVRHSTATARWDPAISAAGPAKGFISPALKSGFAYLRSAARAAFLCARRATHIDHGAVSRRSIRIHELGGQHTAVERHDLAVLLTAGRACGPNIVLAAPAALHPLFLRGGLVGQMHDDASGRPLADHVRLLALSARRILGPHTVFRLVIGGKAPATAQFIGADGGRNLRLDRRLLSHRRVVAAIEIESAATADTSGKKRNHRQFRSGAQTDHKFS